ncbi:hypothetical protein [Paenibacillus macerans]|uniref:hypothetical protein n=1 Tax=Paenibacillus macerans TaxID=44252 RepID=UPI001D1322A3|nr:hypothetical protein [Paenibacillus macerans]
MLSRNYITSLKYPFPHVTPQANEVQKCSSFGPNQAIYTGSNAKVQAIFAILIKLVSKPHFQLHFCISLGKFTDFSLFQLHICIWSGRGVGTTGIWGGRGAGITGHLELFELNLLI